MRDVNYVQNEYYKPKNIKPGPILDIVGMIMFFRENFLKKGRFVCLHTINRCYFIHFWWKYFFPKLRALDWVQ